MAQSLAGEHSNPIRNLRDRVLGWWNERQEISRELQEIAALGDHGVEELATDVGLNPQLLAAVIRHGASAADDMERLMKALNIDADAVHFDMPAFYREMKVSCALCDDKTRCRHELEDGTAPENYAHFCPNHEIMSELRARPEFQID